MIRVLKRQLAIWWHGRRARRELTCRTPTAAEAWPLVERVFVATHAIYCGRVGPAAYLPFEAEILHLLTQCPDAEDVLRNHLRSDDAQIKAYCLAGLNRLGSNHLLNPPVDVLEDETVVEVRAGCFFQRLTVADYANELRKAQQKRVSAA